MKKLMGILVLFLLIVWAVAVCLCAASFANMGPQAGRYNLSKDWVIYNQVLATNLTNYPVTLESSVVSINIQALNGDVRWSINGTTTEVYWTIPDGNTYWDHYAIPLETGTQLHFWSPTAGTTVEVLVNVR